MVIEGKNIHHMADLEQAKEKRDFLCYLNVTG